MSQLRCLFLKLLHFLVICALLAANLPVTRAQANSISQLGFSDLPQSSSSVSITDNGFVPFSITIQQGTQLQWINQGAQTHQVKSGAPDSNSTHLYLPLVIKSGQLSTSALSHEQSTSAFTASTNFISPMLQPGESFSFAFTEPGSFSYYDPTHPTLTGQVIVTANAPVQNQNPILTLLSPAADAVVGSGNLVVTGTAQDPDGSVASVEVNGVSAGLNGTAFSVTISIQPGNQTITAVAKDNQGGTATANRLVQAEGNGPVIKINAPKDNQSVYSSHPQVTLHFADDFSSVDLSSLQVTLTGPDSAARSITGDLNISGQTASGALKTALTGDAVYQLTVSLKDSRGNSSNKSISFYVPANPDSIIPPVEIPDSGWISGRVYDSSTCTVEKRNCKGLPGVSITLEEIDPLALNTTRAERQALAAINNLYSSFSGAAIDTATFTGKVAGTIISGPNGFFAFPVSATGHYWLRADKSGYTYGQREATILLAHSTATNEIYLTPIDTSLSQCDMQGCDHKSADGVMEVEIPAGAIPQGQTVQVSATEFEHVEFLPSGTLPEGTAETYAFNLGGASEATFTQPVTVKIANSRNFAPGTKIPLGYWNQNTQAWEPTGHGTVDPTGQWVMMQVMHFSNYDCNFSMQVITPSLGASTTNQSNQGNGCDGSAAVKTNCEVEIASGVMKEDVSLPSVQVMGEEVAPRLIYNSRRASPSTVIDIQLDINPTPDVTVGQAVDFELYIEGNKTDSVTFTNSVTNGEVGRFRYLWDGRDAQGNPLPPGIYQYQARFRFPYRGQYCGSVTFGGMPDCTNWGTGVYLDTTMDRWTQGTVKVEGDPTGEFGQGWMLEGMQHLTEGEDGRILITDGSGSSEFVIPARSKLNQPNANALDNQLLWLNQMGSITTMKEEDARTWPKMPLLASGGLPEFIQLSPDGNWAYTNNPVAGLFVVIDLKNRQIANWVPTATYPRGFAFSPDRSRVYVATSRGAGLTVIDTATWQALDPIPVGNEGGGPFSVQVSPDGKYAYAVLPEENRLAVIDFSVQKEVASIPVGNQPYFLALSPDGQMAYVSNYSSNDLSVVDLAAQQLVATIAMNGSPMGITVMPDGKTALVANTGSNSVSWVDLVSHQEVTQIHTDASPYTITLSPDGKYAYVSSESTIYYNSRVDVIDLSTRRVTGMIPAGIGAKSIAINADGKTGYVVNNGEGMVTQVRLPEDVQPVTWLGASPSYAQLSNDGKTLYTAINGYPDYALAIMDTISQAVNFIPLSSYTNELRLSPLQPEGSPSIAYALLNDSTLAFVDLVTGEQVAALPLPAYYGSGMILSHDGRYAYISYDDTQGHISIIDLSARTFLSDITCPTSYCEVAALSKDDQKLYLVDSSNQTLSVIDLVTRNVQKTITFEHNPRRPLVSPDGAYLYLASVDWGNYRGIYVIDMALDQVVDQYAFLDNSELTDESVFSPDGKYIYSPQGGVINVIDVAAKRGTDWVSASIYTTSLAISPDGARLYGSSEDLWGVQTFPLAPYRQLSTKPLPLAMPANMVVSPFTGQAFIASKESDTEFILRAANLIAGSISDAVRLPEMPWKSMQLSPDGTTVYFTGINKFYSFPVNDPASLYAFDLPVNDFYDFVLSVDGKTAYLAHNSGYGHPYGGMIDILNLETQQLRGWLSASVSDVSALAIDPARPWLYVTGSSDGRLAIYDLKKQETLATIETGTNPNSVSITPDGRYAYVSAYQSSTIAVIDLQTFQKVKDIFVRGGANRIVFAADSQFAYAQNLSPFISVIDLSLEQTVASIPAGYNSAYGLTLVQTPQPRATNLTVDDFSTLTYNAADQTYTRSYPDGTTVHFTSEGRHDFTLTPQGSKTEYIYNPDETLSAVSITAPGQISPHWIWTFDYIDGKLTRITDPAGRESIFQVDTWDHLTHVILPDGAVHQYRYSIGDTSSGLMTHIINPNGEITEFHYDTYGRVQQAIEPDRVVFNPATGKTEVKQDIRTYQPADTSLPLVNAMKPGGSPTAPPKSVDLVSHILDGSGQSSGHTNAFGAWSDHTDSLNRTTEYTRNLSNQVTQVKFADGSCRRLEYDGNGNLTSDSWWTADQCAGMTSTKPNGWTYTYEPTFNHLKSVQDPLGNTTTFVYDYEENQGTLGSLIRIVYSSVTDDQGQTFQPAIHFTYTPSGQIETFTGQDGIITRFVYSQGTSAEAYGQPGALFARDVPPVPGLLTQVIEDAGTSPHLNLVTQYLEFDAVGHPQAAINPRGGKAQYQYDLSNRLIASTSPSDSVAHYQYDPAGNLTQVVEGYTADGSGLNLTTQFTYNPAGQWTSSLTQADGVTQRMGNEYDINGNLTRQTTPFGATTYEYDAANQLVTMTDATQARFTFQYSVRGELLSQTAPDGRVVKFAYDERGNLTQIEPPGKPAHTFAYQANNLLASSSAPPVQGAGSTTSYQYNALGQITFVTRPDDQVVNLAYDRALRLSKVSYGQGTVSYQYQPNGLLSALSTSAGEQVNYTYDQDLMAKASWAGAVQGNVSQTYDSAYRQTSQSVNGQQTVQFAYSPEDLLLQAGDLKLTYLPHSGLPSGTNVGKVQDSLTYDGNGSVSQYRASSTLGSYLDISYQHDALGRIQSIQETSGAKTFTDAFTYDTSGRLVRVERNGNLLQAYTYDPNGNRLSASGPQGQINATYDDQDRLLSYGAAAYTYTSSGELQSVVEGERQTTYTYDALGNLTAVQLPNGKRIDYLVDGSNRRVGKKVGGTLVQGFLWEGALRLVAELNGQNQVVSRFVYATGVNMPAYMVKNGVTYRILTDHLGSVRLVVNTTTGAVAQRLAYDPFGQVLEDTNPGFQPFGFAGGLYDPDTGLVRFGARDYDTRTGRWTAKDPIGFKSRTTNLYEYGFNNPVMYVDPDGQLPIVPLAIIGGLLLLKVLDYGWTAYDMNQSRQVLADPCSSQREKELAAANITMALAFEAAEPDEISPVSLPVDDIARIGVNNSLKNFADITVDDVLSNPSLVEGATKAEIEAIIPNSWSKGPMARGEGVRYLNPDRPGQAILIEKGSITATDALHSGPYLRVSNGRGKAQRVALKGNPTLYR